MTDLSQIPIDELRRDLSDSYMDIENCKSGLLMGIEEVKGTKLTERIESNQRIIEIINAELLRRMEQK